jgi:hypothetical protein
MFSILETEDRNEPECVCCPVRDICESTEPILITKNMLIRSGCDGEVFMTWDYVSGVE